jgi:CRISPR-associated protein Cas2
LAVADRSLVVVAYDISDDKRRARAAQLLLSYGARVEASVYELWLTARQIEKMWHGLARLVKDGDLVRCYTVCEACVRRVRSNSIATPKDDIAYFA